MFQGVIKSGSTRRWTAILGIAVVGSLVFGGLPVAQASPPATVSRMSSSILAPQVRLGGFAAIVPAVVPVEDATLINSVVTGAGSPPAIDPAGIAYLSDKGELIVSDSEVDEEPSVFIGVNLFQLTLTGSVTATGLSPDLPVEPTGLSYDPASKTLFISNDQTERVYLVTAGADGTFGTPDDSHSSFSAAAFGSTDTEDVAFDTRSGDLFLAEGNQLEVYRIDPGPNGLFDGIAPDGDDSVTSFDISGLGIEDAEGIGYRPESDTILVVDAGSDESIFEFTKTGHLLRRIDLGVIQQLGVPETPSDVVVAPASDGSPADHLYVVDRKADNGDPNDGIPPAADGMLYELSAPFDDLAPYVDAGTDAVVTIGAGADLQGLAYDDGQPVIDGLTTTWSKSSGPGVVTFANSTSTSTTASFDAIGTYILQLSASDTAASTVDTVQITVIPDPVVNTPPVPDAGPDLTVVVNQMAALGGSVIDDGLPDPPGALTNAWTKTSGPGSVNFSNPTALTTSVSFSTVGVYTIRLTSSDSELNASDEITVTVVPDPVVDCSNDDFVGAGFVDLGGLSQESVDAIDCLVFFGISNGTSPAMFSPFMDVTRWQMALFLTRQAQVEGVVLPDGSDQGFADISAYPAQTQIAINRLAQLGITEGTAPGVYSPDDVVTRWQMALFLTRFLDLVGVPIPSGSGQGYGDIGDLPQSTQDAINQITQLGVAQGTGTGVYAPLSPVTRWQMALFLIRSIRIGGLG